MAVQSNYVYPPLILRGFYFCVSGAADKRYSLASLEMKNSERYKRHWSFVVTDKKYLYPFVALLTVAGILAGIRTGDPTYFSRVGNFIIGIGVWMSMRYTLREGINKHKDFSDFFPTIPGNGPTYQTNAKFFNEITFSIGDAMLQVHGFFIVLYGSAVSSFGDMILKWVIEKC